MYSVNKYTTYAIQYGRDTALYREDCLYLYKHFDFNV